MPEVIRTDVEPCRPGVYVLGNECSGFMAHYIGRSDKCLQTRLLNHNYLYQFSYFIFRYASNPREAFYLECQLWHYYADLKHMYNKIHPASPADSAEKCPYCQFSEAMVTLFDF
ncbi:hypothetical protein H6G27_16925 [Nostoc linckia FACHB-104]|nr:hypothetical protein [Nostoc linckia FACHB-104]